MSKLEWSRQSSGEEQLRLDRLPLMRTVRYERTVMLSDTASLEGHNGTALTINVSKLCERGKGEIVDEARSSL